MSNTPSQNSSIWSRRSTFILAAAGSAIGLGNLWKFPYMAGENGGGAFVLVYLLCILVIGLPIMMSESLIGRRSHSDAMTAIREAASDSNGSAGWQIIAGIGFICVFLLFSFYSVIAGWALDYTVGFASGSFTGKTQDDVGAMFDGLLASPARLIGWHTLFTILTAVIIMGGARKGIEKAITVLMPLLIAILFGMLIFSATQTGKFMDGVHFLFNWSPEKLKDPSVIISALGHAFFSLSLGMCAIMTYASYMQDDVSITQSALWVTALDTIIALVAGLVIFPIVFAHGMEAGSGPGLLFVTLSTAFADGGGLGSLLGVVFFFLVSIAALSSSISIVEPVVRWTTERFSVSRKAATVFYCVLTWLLGLATVFSFNIWSDVHLLGNGKTPFDLIDYLVSNILLPLGGLLIALFTGWVVSKNIAREQLPELSNGLFNLWRFMVKFVAPVAILLVFYSVIVGK